ncbi:DUF3631 domain-containing protein [Corynebacterium marquesiae]|uniref:DUF3631 domain-containing protein n=1 Tax=Corynebacterium marquesiae TaxID=2913503 RepID=UPI0040434365
MTNDRNVLDIRKDTEAIMARYKDAQKPAQAPTPEERSTPHDEVLNKVVNWLARFIKPAHQSDLQLLTLWIVHTHLTEDTFTTPRLLLDSPVPGSGKSTVLDHIQRLAYRPVQAASLSSPSLLARLLQSAPRTILIDEAEKTLSPKTDGVGDLLAVLNSGYRKGASRPVLVPDKDSGWKPVEMSTFGPVAMAGNAPNLPEDTKQRCIKVMLLPDTKGTVEDSEWQWIEDDALLLGASVAQWADNHRDEIRHDRPTYPHGLTGRNRERWAPLLKVARAASPMWEKRCETLIKADLEDQEEDRKAGLQRIPRHVQLLKDIRTAWPTNTSFWPTDQLLAAIKVESPHKWTSDHKYGDLSAQGLGRMLSSNFKIRSGREKSGSRRRGYFKTDFEQAWTIFTEPDEVDEPVESDGNVA